MPGATPTRLTGACHGHRTTCPATVQRSVADLVDVPGDSGRSVPDGPLRSRPLRRHHAAALAGTGAGCARRCVAERRRCTRRRAGHGSRRCSPRPRGYALKVEERWEDGGQQWYCREAFLCDLDDQGRIADFTLYCTGDWDEARVAEHARGGDAAAALMSPSRATTGMDTGEVDAAHAGGAGPRRDLRLRRRAGRIPAVLFEAYEATRTTRRPGAARLRRWRAAGPMPASGPGRALRRRSRSSTRRPPATRPSLADALDAALATHWGPTSSRCAWSSPASSPTSLPTSAMPRRGLRRTCGCSLSPPRPWTCPS